jgi:hypothetical protein
VVVLHQCGVAEPHPVVAVAERLRMLAMLVMERRAMG